MQSRLPKVWWRLALRIEITRIEQLRPDPLSFKLSAREQNGYFTTTTRTVTNRIMEIKIPKTNPIFCKAREGVSSHVRGEAQTKDKLL